MGSTSPSPFDRSLLSRGDGLEVRYYALEADLSPAFSDLESRIDADTVAVLSINYFGFPQPGFGDVTSLAADYGCYHVDDNAHSVLSVHDGELLGTRGHLGITSLRKLLPVPDGGLLYADPEVTDRLESAQTWPRLPGAVLEDPAHSTAVTLAERMVVLPVHQHVDLADIHAISDSVGRK